MPTEGARALIAAAEVRLRRAEIVASVNCIVDVVVFEVMRQVVRCIKYECEDIVMMMFESVVTKYFYTFCCRLWTIRDA